MYICDLSRSVGAARAITRKTRGLTRSTMRLMVPPLPAVSRPSKTMQIFAPLALTHSCMATSSAWSRASSASYSRRFILLPGSWSFAVFLPTGRLRSHAHGVLVPSESGRRRARPDPPRRMICPGGRGVRAGGSLPLDRARRLGGDVDRDPVDLADLVGDPGRDLLQHLVGQPRPVGGHGVLRGHRAQHHRVAVGAPVTLHSHRTDV